MIEPNKINNDEIIDLLDDKEVIEMDDVIMIVSSTGVPHPLKSTVDGLIKQENDPISADIPFQSMVNTDNVLLVFPFYKHNIFYFAEKCRSNLQSRWKNVHSPQKRDRQIQSLE